MFKYDASNVHIIYTIIKSYVYNLPFIINSSLKGVKLKMVDNNIYAVTESTVGILLRQIPRATCLVQMLK